MNVIRCSLSLIVVCFAAGCGSKDDGFVAGSASSIVAQKSNSMDDRKRDRPRESLHAALDDFDGDMTKALESMGLHLTKDSKGRVTMFSDPMMNGTLDDDEFSLLAKAPSQTAIGLRASRVTDGGLSALEKMPQLTGLSFEGSAITDAGLVHLRHLKNLQTLDLERVKVNGTELVHISHPEHITSIRLMECKKVGDDALKIISSFVNLEKLNL